LKGADVMPFAFDDPPHPLNIHLEVL
jgi:hypothetical protein